MRTGPQGFTPPPPSLPARAQRDGSTRPVAEITDEEEGEQRAPPLPSGGAVHTVAHYTRPTPLEGTAVARARQNLEPEEGGDVVLLLTPAQLKQKRVGNVRPPGSLVDVSTTKCTAEMEGYPKSLRCVAQMCEV